MFEKNSYTCYLLIQLPLFIILLFLLAACSKPDKEYAVIKGTTNHHEWEVPGLKVYIKKNAPTFPGFNSAVYDDSTVSVSSERFKAPFVFRYLEPGDYYLMANGYDTLFGMPVKGALGVSIYDNYEIKNVQLIVSE
ncbi:MAG: hypothetical protein WCP57_01405 [Bacteroidota bacterium]